MEIYSPKSQKSVSFTKNTVKGDVMISKKGEIRKTEITIDSKKENEPKKNKEIPGVSFFDFLKVKFYNRMKVFFDYEDKYTERNRVGGSKS